MNIEKEFVVRQPVDAARAVLDSDETIVSLFPETEIISREGDVRETRTHYRGFGSERDIRFRFTSQPSGLVFEKICDGNVWRSLEGCVRLRGLGKGSTHVVLSMSGRTRALVPEITIRAPMHEQIEQMTKALRARLDAA